MESGHNKTQNSNTAKSNRKKTPRQIAAIGAVILLVSMYVITFIASFCFPVSSGNLFMLCLFGTVAIPFLLWIYLWLYQKMTHREDDFPREDEHC